MNHGGHRPKEPLESGGPVNSFLRIVVAEKRSKMLAPPVEDLGSYNPFTKKANLNKDRVSHWIKVGAQPTVTAISPNSGPTSGGTSVTITGTGFATGATVTIGGAAATNVTVDST